MTELDLAKEWFLKTSGSEIDVDLMIELGMISEETILTLYRFSDDSK